MNNLLQELNSMNILDLRYISKELGVSSKGDKKSIVNRLLLPFNRKYRMNTKTDGEIRKEFETFEGYIGYDILQNPDIMIEKMFTNLLKRKKCKTNYKYCDIGNYMGDCIHDTLNCRDTISHNKRYSSRFKLFILNLEKRKMTIDSYNYTYQYKNQFDMRYKFPKPGQIHSSYYLVQIDIDRLKAYMGESYTDAAGHNKIYTKNNIELLSWLLAGLHNQSLNSDLATGIRFNQSYIKHYFGSTDSFLKVPIVNCSNGIFEIIDGRHRLGFYNYFNVNGLILTNKNGIDTLSKNNININSVTINDTDIQQYFYKNIFNNIENVKNKTKQMMKDIARKIVSTIKCRKCGGNHWTKDCPKNK